jgi:hypothetical protein
MDDMAIASTECGREVDEFTAIAKGWRYYSDGCGDLCRSARRALDVSSLTTLPRALHRLALGVATPVARVLRLDEDAALRIAF